MWLQRADLENLLEKLDVVESWLSERFTKFSEVFPHSFKWVENKKNKENKRTTGGIANIFTEALHGIWTDVSDLE